MGGGGEDARDVGLVDGCCWIGESLVPPLPTALLPSRLDSTADSIVSSCPAVGVRLSVAGVVSTFVLEVCRDRLGPPRESVELLREANLGVPSPLVSKVDERRTIRDHLDFAGFGEPDGVSEGVDIVVEAEDCGR